MDRKKIQVKVFSDRKRYKVIEVYENELEVVKAANRLVWKEEKKEERQRIRTRKANITFFSFEELDNDGVWIADENLNAEEQIIVQETIDETKCKLMNAISQLRPRQQMIISKIFFGGMSQRQVAEELGITKFALSHALSVIYSKLRKLL